MADIGGGVPLGQMKVSAHYEQPAKYKGITNDKGQLLAGKRIDPRSELGKELVKLRVMWKAAAEANRRLSEDEERRMKEMSANVPLNLNEMAAARWRDERDQAIRKRILDIVDGVYAEHGRPPTTIGVPAETFEEVREACSDFPVTFVVQDVA